MTLGGWRLVTLQSVLLTVLLTWPLVADPLHVVIGDPEADTLKHVWTLWWMRAELWGGVPGVVTTFANAPFGLELYPIEPLHGFAAALLPVGPVLLSNLLLFTNQMLLGLSAARLARACGCVGAGVHAAAALTQASPFAANLTHLGVGELRLAWMIVVGLVIAVRMRERPQLMTGLGLGVWVGLTTFACFYNGLFLVVAVGAYALLQPRLAWKYLAGYVIAAALGFGLSVGPFLSFDATERETQAWARSTNTTDAKAADLIAVSVSQMLTPREASRDRQLRAYTGGRYLGWGLLGLVVIGVGARPKQALPWVIVAAWGILWALGPVLMVQDGRAYTVGGQVLALPGGWANEWLSAHARPLHFYSRFLAIPAIALPLAAAFAVERWRWLLLLVPLCILEAEWADSVLWPRESQRVPTLTGLSDATLTRLGVVGPLFDLTPALGRDPSHRADALALQIQSGRGTQAVMIERMDTYWPQGQDLLLASPLHGCLATHRRCEVPVGEARTDLVRIRAHGYGGVALVGARTSERADATVTAVLGEPYRFGAARIWSFGQTPLEDPGDDLMPAP